MIRDKDDGLLFNKVEDVVTVFMIMYACYRYRKHRTGSNTSFMDDHG